MGWIAVLLTVLKTLWAVWKEASPFVFEWLKTRNAGSLAQARQRALDLQNQAAKQAKLAKEGNVDELSRMENFQLDVLDQLFRSRELRLQRSKPPGGNETP